MVEQLLSEATAEGLISPGELEAAVVALDRGNVSRNQVFNRPNNRNGIVQKDARIADLRAINVTVVHFGTLQQLASHCDVTDLSIRKGATTAEDVVTVLFTALHHLSPTGAKKTGRLHPV
ncbi:hypothetical protein V3C99_018792 [Haemonchus contortus]|uniref:DUF4158 domain-containing protein n=1 Tax=Haemonchus contortus TaxID=6289 RepID=A0A7I4Z349_HAECO